MVTAGATANTTEENSRTSRESGVVVFTDGLYKGERSMFTFPAWAWEAARTVVAPPSSVC